jgi:hypothetical protein
VYYSCIFRGSLEVLNYGTFTRKDLDPLPELNEGVLCNRFITICLANDTLRTHAMSHRAKSVTPLMIAKLQNFLNRLEIDSPHLGRADRAHDDTNGNGAGRGDGKR